MGTRKNYSLNICESANRRDFLMRVEKGIWYFKHYTVLNKLIIQTLYDE